jgi:hypothetical protein
VKAATILRQGEVVTGEELGEHVAGLAAGARIAEHGASVLMSPTRHCNIKPGNILAHGPGCPPQAAVIRDAAAWPAIWRSLPGA